MTTIGIISRHKPHTQDILNRFILSRGISNISAVSICAATPPYPCGVYVIEEPVKNLNGILTGKSGIIITADEFLRSGEYAIPQAYIISCSLSMRSTITASSIDDGRFTYCIQREFSDINKTPHQPQEFGISFCGKAENIYHYLAAVTALVACGIPKDKLTDFTF